MTKKTKKTNLSSVVDSVSAVLQDRAASARDAYANLVRSLARDEEPDLTAGDIAELLSEIGRTTEDLSIDVSLSAEAGLLDARVAEAASADLAARDAADRKQAAIVARDAAIKEHAELVRHAASFSVTAHQHAAAAAAAVQASHDASRRLLKRLDPKQAQALDDAAAEGIRRHSEVTRLQNLRAELLRDINTRPVGYDDGHEHRDQIARIDSELKELMR